MDKGKRVFSPALFGLIIICFLLPFVNISCGGQQMLSLNGLQLVTGTEYEGESIGPSAIAIIMFLMAIAGLVLALAKTKLGNLLCSIAAGIGFVFTLILKFNINSEIAQEGYLSAEWSSGYYLTLILFLAALGFNIYLLNTKKDSVRSTFISPPAGSRFCPQCGTRNQADSDYCSQCGYRISPVGTGVQAAGKVAPEYTPPVYEPEVDYHSPTIAEAAPAADDDATQLLQQPVFPVLKINRNGTEETVPINKPEFLLGRNRDVVDYCEADNNNVGRTHAKIITKDDMYFIVDLDSKNGTSVNGQRLTSGEPYPLAFGDKITLANADYIFDEA